MYVFILSYFALCGQVINITSLFLIKFTLFSLVMDLQNIITHLKIYLESNFKWSMFLVPKGSFYCAFFKWQACLNIQIMVLCLFWGGKKWGSEKSKKILEILWIFKISTNGVNINPVKKSQNLTFSSQDLLTQQLFLKIDGMVVDIQLGGWWVNNIRLWQI